MSEPTTTPGTADDFIRRWEASGAAERANYAMFLAELCDLLNVPRPEPSRPDDLENAYVFERAVTFQNGDGSTSAGRIDLYKRGCFVLEAKQGSERPEGSGELFTPRRPRRRGTAVRGTAGWDDAMLAARGQAEQYVRALPASEPNPPFLIVVDVGHSIELLADFTRQGRTYTPFPDALSHRVKLTDLADGETRERLRLVWTDPLNLDPSRRSAKVTREVADRLARLAVSLEKSNYSPEAVAQFLMRCIFTFFAEDVGLLPKESFTTLLSSLLDRKETALFPEMVRSLWETMKTGGFSPILRSQVLRFNGGLFESAEALPVTDEQLELLVSAGKKEWRDVEPAIFGTLLERALNPIERHKLGAHYTPRAYVERLVMPTIIEPLRDEWANVQTAAVTLANEGDLPKARDEVRAFLRKLCDTTVLDPACGTGNFLYVTLEHMKRLEGEVRDFLRSLGETQAAFEGFGLTVDPHQFRGIEINPRAAAIADLVLWIGYLQWHFRTFGAKAPAEPIIKAFHNIECRDAVLAYDGTEPLRDKSGEVVTRWDGITKKLHPVTGKGVPDDSARVPDLKYLNPRKTEWPEADYIVGNPPFVANRNMRGELGEGYTDALGEAYPDIAKAVDLVMYFWKIAAEYCMAQTIRAGLITTSRIRLQQNQSIVEPAIKKGIRIVFAIPDHPWQGEGSEASVRIAITVFTKSPHGSSHKPVFLLAPDHDSPSRTYEDIILEANELKLWPLSTIPPDLSPSVDIGELKALKSWDRICHAGMKPYAKTLIVDALRARSLFANEADFKHRAPLYLNGQDLARSSRGIHVLDFFEIAEAELMTRYPVAYQYLHDYAKPERAQERNARLRSEWWLFEAPRKELREAIKPLDRYIATVENSPDRYFVFVKSSIFPDQKIRVIASNDALVLGVLSSRIHKVFAMRLGGRHGVANTPVYNTRCAVTFPLFMNTSQSCDAIRSLGEKLDSHRKARQAEHPTLTLTGMYNVLAKLRSGEPLTDKERITHEQGLVSVLKQIHDDLDAAVFDAYGWPHDLKDEEILQRLVDLNRERAAEEARGIIRWLRPEFQNPEGAKTATQTTLIPIEPEPTLPDAAPAKKEPWPKSLAEQAQAVRAALASQPAGMTSEQLARMFVRGQTKRVAELLETLVSLGQARELADGRYVRV